MAKREKSLSKRKGKKPAVRKRVVKVQPQPVTALAIIPPPPPKTDMVKAMELCDFIIEGNSVREAARRSDLEVAKFFRMMAAKGNDALVKHYTRARAGRADARFEQVDEIMEDMRAKLITTDQARVLLDAIKWQTGKENAKRYGEKMEVDHGEQRHTVTFKRG